jgi:hypothetical protein
MAAGAYIRRQQPKPLQLREHRSSSSYLRGLLPFEKGEQLLGRDQEVGRLLAMLRGLEYRFGFLSGEAGAGKKSLLRARIIPDLEKDGYQPIYVPRTGGDPEAAIRKEVVSIIGDSKSLSPTETLVELLRRD